MDENTRTATTTVLITCQACGRPTPEPHYQRTEKVDEDGVMVSTPRALCVACTGKGDAA